MKQILIIEDDQKVQQLYQQALTKLGFSVSVFAEGMTALAELSLNKPNLVILDIMLPGGMNGFDVLEEMKRREELKKIPVLILTNLDSEKDVAKEIGANEYLVKTQVSINQVIEKVKKLAS